VLCTLLLLLLLGYFHHHPRSAELTLVFFTFMFSPLINQLKTFMSSSERRPQWPASGNFHWTLAQYSEAVEAFAAAAASWQCGSEGGGPGGGVGGAGHSRRLSVAEAGAAGTAPGPDRRRNKAATNRFFGAAASPLPEGQPIGHSDGSHFSVVTGGARRGRSVVWVPSPYLPLRNDPWVATNHDWRTGTRLTAFNEVSQDYAAPLRGGDSTVFSGMTGKKVASTSLG